MQLTIRKAKLSDLRKIADYYGPVGDTPHDPFCAVGRLRQLDRTGLLVAEWNDRFAGFLYYFIHKQPWFDPEVSTYAVIDELHVLTEYRRRGIAALHEAWNFKFDRPPIECQENIKRFQKVCEENGLDETKVDKSIGVLFIMSNEEEKVEAGLRRVAQLWRMDLEELKRKVEHSFVGTTERVKTKVEAFARIGVNYFFLWGPGIRNTESMEIFAKDIMKGFS